MDGPYGIDWDDSEDGTTVDGPNGFLWCCTDQQSADELVELLNGLDARAENATHGGHAGLSGPASATEAPDSGETTNEAPGGAEGPQGLAAIVGQWPGDETDEEIEDALRGLRGLPTADDRALGAKLRSLGEVCRIGRVSPALAALCGSRMAHGHREHGNDAADLDLEREIGCEIADALNYVALHVHLGAKLHWLERTALRLLARAARLLGVA